MLLIQVGANSIRKTEMKSAVIRPKTTEPPQIRIVDQISGQAWKV